MMRKLNMKSFSALTAIVLVAIGFGFGSAVRADDPASVDDIPQIEAEQYGTVDGAYLPSVADGAYADFPHYQRCPEPTCCDAKPWHGLFGKLGCGLHQADCCDPCGDPCCDEVGGKCGVVSPRRHGKLHCLRGHWGGLWHGTPTDMYGECCEPVQGKGMWAPADVQSPQAAPVPAPEPTAEPIEELPEPTVTTDYVPKFPDFSTQDRSATRHELRRFPNAFMSL
jgi:hypothetical protein